MSEFANTLPVFLEKRHWNMLAGEKPPSEWCYFAHLLIDHEALTIKEPGKETHLSGLCMAWSHTGWDETLARLWSNVGSIANHLGKTVDEVLALPTITKREYDAYMAGYHRGCSVNRPVEAEKGA